jgi:hypothetical protein
MPVVTTAENVVITTGIADATARYWSDTDIARARLTATDAAFPTQPVLTDPPKSTYSSLARLASQSSSARTPGDEERPARWEKEGVTEAIHELLRGRVRRAAGRTEEPSAAVIDSQTVKTSGNVPEASQGIDAGKRIKGRKRHIHRVPGIREAGLVRMVAVKRRSTCRKGIM